jgi:hypothetical protein
LSQAATSVGCDFSQAVIERVSFDDIFVVHARAPRGDHFCGCAFFLVVTDAFLDPGGVIRIGPGRRDRGRKAQAHKNCQRHKNRFHKKILPFSDVNWAGLAANAPEVTQIFGCILKLA